MKKSSIAALVLTCTCMGAWATATAPVPEPETYAAMLAGVAALTLLGRRRQLPAAQD